ncbi:golgin subfamily A member 6-like protein 22 [Aotus nancymaae]|uniref:golgin subfamily A member 6-like protein 22 n=1 Tax=Aotus nancymaae TaxID=37293 RepID=UPI0030FF2C78
MCSVEEALRACRRPLPGRARGSAASRLLSSGCVLLGPGSQEIGFADRAGGDGAGRQGTEAAPCPGQQQLQEEAMHLRQEVERVSGELQTQLDENKCWSHLYQQQEEKIWKQSGKIWGQEHKMLEQQEKIRVQEHKIREQGHKMLEQQEKIRDQEHKIREQGHKMLEQQEKIQEQAHKMREQELKNTGQLSADCTATRHGRSPNMDGELLLLTE